MTTHSGLSGYTLVSGYLSGALILGLPSHPLSATTYFVNPATGSDTALPAEAQNPSTPWKTLTRAWNDLQPGDVLQLQAGTYADQAVGGLESFPLTLKPGVQVRGEGPSSTHLEAPQDVPLFEQSGAVETLFWLSGLTLDHPGPSGDPHNSALLLHPDQGSVVLSLEDLHLGSGSDAGIRLELTGPQGADALLDLNVNASTFSGDSGIVGDFDGLDAYLALSIALTDASFEVAEAGLDLSQVGGDGGYGLDLQTLGSTFVGGNHGIRSVHQATGNAGPERWMVSDSTFAFLQAHALSLYVTEQVMTPEATREAELTVLGNQFSDGGLNDILTELSQLSGGALRFASQIGGNTFSRSGADAIALRTHSLELLSTQLDFAITDNTIGMGSSSSGSGISLVQNAWTGGAASITQTLSGNTITDASGSGLSLLLSSLFSVTLDYTTEVSGNVLEDLGAHGALLHTLLLDSVDGALAWTLSNNTIAHADASGIQFQAESFRGGGSSQLELKVLDNSLRQVCVSCGKAAITSGLYVLNGPLTLSLDSTFSGNTISGTGGDGVLVSHAMSSLKPPRFEDRTVITDNVVEAVAQHGVQLRHSYILGEGLVDLESTVAGNQITQTGGNGIQVSAQNLQNAAQLAYGLNLFNNVLALTDSGVVSSFNGVNAVDNLALALDLVGNQVEEAVTRGSRGLDVSVLGLSQTTGTLDLRVSGNAVRHKGGEGIAIALDSQEVMESNSVEIQDNLLTSNQVGLSLSSQNYLAPHMDVSGNTFQKNAQYAAWLLAPPSSPGTTPANTLYADLGGGPLGSLGRNTFQDTASGTELRLDATSTSAQLKAQGNAWIETDAAAIQARITSSGAQVDTSQPLDAPPEPDANATLSVLLLQDEGLPGPGPGDTLRVTAQLSSTGAIGCAAGSFSLSLPAGATLVADSPNVSQGAVFSQDDAGFWAGLYWPGAGQTLLVQADVQVTSDDCAPLELQAHFWCEQLGEMPTDDPSTTAEDDATVIPITTRSVYTDADHDGQGDASSEVSSCQAILSEGTSVLEGDCDDQNPTVYSGGIEVCDGLDNDCNGTPDQSADGSSPGQPWYQDSDKDSYGVSSVYIVSCTAPDAYAALPGDCDDSSDQVSPAAPESCNGIDDDCDGTPDDGFSLTPLYLDQDADGYGDSSQPLLTCESAVSGYSSQDGDCDDTRIDVHPGAIDVCDGLDNDCTGTPDDGPAPLLYLDEDTDGYGTEAMSISACPQTVEGFVETYGDCDDASSDIHPGAEEVCNLQDDNCDDSVDEGFSTSAWYVDVDGDGYGAESSALEACTAPDGTVALGGDCDDHNNLVYPGALERCDGVDNSCDGTAEALEACPPEVTPLPDTLAIVGNGLSCSVGASGDPTTQDSLPLGALLLGLLLRRQRRRKSSR